MGYQQLWLPYNQLFNLFFFLILFQVTCLHAQLCSQEQNSALLQLKGTFSFNKSALLSLNNSSYCGSDGINYHRRMVYLESWKKGSDCCLWDGVDCDEETGQIIGLDLSWSCLQGTIHPNSTIFHSFPHLQKLSLAGCGFSGKVPLEVSFLSKLVLLDLSGNYGLRLEEGGFELLVQNLSKIRYLDLFGVNMSSSVVPKSMLNLTSLRTLSLGGSGLRGEFPSGIFHLPHLQELVLGDDEALTGYLPDFMNSSYPLQSLALFLTGFSGVMPDSVANLKSLESFELTNCLFHGSIPASLGNLRNLKILDLSYNNFSGFLPSSISNLRNLVVLFLRNNNFAGPFFSWDTNLTKLELLDVSNNCLIGPLPSQGIVAPNLCWLKIGQNLINGTIPSWVFKLPVLESLNLSHNKLIGHTLEFQSTSLGVIDLSYNNLHGTVPNSTFELPNLIFLLLSSNSFSGTIPESHRFSENLIVLELQKNNFCGIIHDSFKRENSLDTINLNSNGFEGPVPKSFVHCRQLKVLDLGNNKFHDKFPHWLEHLPKLHILILRSNIFHGPMLTFKTKFPFPSLRVIDMSDNYLTGPLPEEYFRNFQAMVNVDDRHLGLQYMSGGGVYYSLNMVIKGSLLEEKVLTYFIAIDLSRNQFEGNIPEIVGRLNSV